MTTKRAKSIKNIKDGGAPGLAVASLAGRLKELATNMENIEEEAKDVASQRPTTVSSVKPQVVTPSVPSFKITRLDFGAVETLHLRDRSTILKFLSNVIKMLDDDKEIITDLLNSIRTNYRIEDPITGMLLSKLLENSSMITREQVKMARLITELSLHWEALEITSAASEDSYDTLAENAKDVHAEGLDILGSGNPDDEPYT